MIMLTVQLLILTELHVLLMHVNNKNAVCTLSDAQRIQLGLLLELQIIHNVLIVH